LCPIHPVLQTKPQQTFSCFPNLKTTLKGPRFQTIEEIQENVIRELCAITESAFQEAFQQRKKHPNKGRNIGNGVLPVDGTTLKGTVLNP